MGKTVIATISTTTLLKREDCKRTKHDSGFSQWKILIGPSDWRDYLLNKEGAERYRTQNLPNCVSCSGVYELGIAVSLPRSEGKSSSKVSSTNIIPVYLGQADNVRTRLQQYGRDGAHLENGWSNGKPSDRKGLGLFSDTLSKGFAIAFRWAPMESKKDAEKTESELLKTFNYAWNRGMNGERRPTDIHRKLITTTSPKTLPPVFKNLHIFPPKKVGITIKRCDPPVSEIGSVFYTKQSNESILPSFFKFTRSRPTLVSKDFDTNININTRKPYYCGVASGQGSICIKPPVEGRKRCEDHKGMKVNGVVKPHLLSDTKEFCTKEPFFGKKQCEDHKGTRIHGQGHVSSSFISHEKDLETETCGAMTINGSFCRRKKRENSKFCWQHESSGVLDSNQTSYSSTCGAITINGSFCKRKKGENSQFCWQHESSRVSDSNRTCYSSTCGAITKRGTFCARRTTGGQRCFQH